MAAKAPITWQDYEFGGDVYHITVRHYDEKLGHVTAEWWRQSDQQKGSLDYGVRNCDQAISLAETAIRSQAANR